MPELALLGGEVGHEKLEGILELPRQSAFGEDAYVGVFMKAAALLRSMVVNHPFMDGNKRMGIASAFVFLLINRYVCCADEDEVVNFTVGVAAGQVRDLEEIAAWIESRSITLDEMQVAAESDELELLATRLSGGRAVSDRPLMLYMTSE